MRKEEEEHDNVYGENHPSNEANADKETRSIRQEIGSESPDGVAGEMDAARERQESPTGGMGRKQTPKDGPSQGGWQRPEEPLGQSGE